jgi:Uma2 family endonuclease
MSIAEKTRPESDGSVVVLHHISWETYAALRDMPDNWKLRMTYDRGELEMMSPSRRHESFATLIGSLIEVWRTELDIPVTSLRTMTIRRKDLNRGFEPDNCYYVQNEPRIWDKGELDFTVDPPPDLAIEVEVSRRSSRKMRLYASFRVPELWRCDGQDIQVYELSADGQYVPRATSICFPQFPIAEAQEIIRQLGTVRETTLVRSFRDWVRENVATSGD